MQTSRITNSVIRRLARMAPTKNPSSRLKREWQLGQWWRIRKGLLAIDSWPHAGQRKRRERDKTVRIDVSLVVMVVRCSQWLPDNLLNSFRDFLRLQYSNDVLHLPKKPGSIKYQLTNPAAIPITNTSSMIIFSLVVVGFPAIEGNIRRKSPPITQSGAKAASFTEYSCSCNS